MHHKIATIASSEQPSLISSKCTPPQEFLRFDESLKGGFRHVRGEDSDYEMPLSLISPAGSSVGNFSSALVEPSSLTSAAVYETGTLDEGDGIRA